MLASNSGNLPASSTHLYMLKKQLGAVGRKRLGGLFVFKKELLCQRLHPQNSHGTLLAQNQASAPSFLQASTFNSAGSRKANLKCMNETEFPKVVLQSRAKNTLTQSVDLFT